MPGKGLQRAALGGATDKLKHSIKLILSLRFTVLRKTKINLRSVGNESICKNAK